MGGGGKGIVADPKTYGGAAAEAPPGPAGPAPAGAPNSSPFGVAAAGFNAADDAGVPGDNVGLQGDDAERRAAAEDAAMKFPAGEAEAAGNFKSLGDGEMGQMFPQLVSGIAGGIAGAVGGALGPLMQVPQGLMQAGQQAMQAGMGALKDGGDGLGGDSLADMSDEDLANLMSDPSFSDGGVPSGDSGDTSGGGQETTSPTAYLGPPPVPSSSVQTAPSSAPASPVPITPTSTGSRTGMPMGGGMMPMMPGAGGHGAGGAGGGEKPSEKRIAAPGVPNGQPVKGRMTPRPGVAEVKPVEAKTMPAARKLVPKVDTEAKDA